ncbi:MAG: prepilin-type N-terminal cleavage/methylation domain-containing protein [Legionellales bacterium]|nr:prepilin-type N-terminal cleavage/methylation domain-containing protein [Legionellales bacterium]
MVKSNGFTLIELISIIIILGILSAVAIPRYYSYKADAQLTMVKATLGNVRTAIQHYYLNRAVTDGEPEYPTFLELSSIGVVMQEPIPANPYNNSADIRDAVEEYSPTSGTTVSGTQGWAYDELSGKFWVNTGTVNGTNINDL